LVAALYFGGTLLPALGFINVYPMRYSFVADHFQYLASIGLLTLAAVVVTTGASRLSHPKVGHGLAAVLLAGLMLLTWRQCGIYRDCEMLWRDTLAKNPNSFAAHVNLGNLLAGQDRRAEAIRHYHLSLRAKPEHNPEAAASLLVISGEQAAIEGRADEALTLFRKAFTEYGQFPFSARAHHSAGVVLMQQGKFSEAIEHFRLSVAIEPTPGALVRLGRSLTAIGERTAAVAVYREALRLDPSRADARKGLEELLR
jgi:tetratricopeptide (TPR) repeat protein